MSWLEASRTLTVSGAALPQYNNEPILRPVKLSGEEALGELFKYTLELKTPDTRTFPHHIAANISLDKLIGSEVTVSIQLEGRGHFIPGLAGSAGQANIGAGTREITGIVSEARIVREEGRAIVYEFTLRPWLWYASQDKDSRLFQDMTVVEITDAVLNAYSFPFDKRLTLLGRQTWPKRDMQRQYWESDWAFLQRLWEEWGIFYFFEHSHGHHRLVLCNSIATLKLQSTGYETIRYAASGGQRIDEEHIHELSVAHALTAGTVTSIDYDYTWPRADLNVKTEDPRDTALANQEHYTWGDMAQPQAGAPGLSGEHNEPRTEAEYLTRVQMDAHRCQGWLATGKGNLRGLVTGQTFKLSHYPQDKANREYAVIGSKLTIEEIDDVSGTGQQYRCETELTLLPRGGGQFALKRTIAKPKVGGTEYAIVTCPQDQAIWTDAYGRVKVQFLWDRLGQKNEHSSCWVRVAGVWQGNQFGAIFLPRAGQEVQVAYVNGDPDLPIIIGSAVNAFNPPPYELPKNQALSAIRSCEIGGLRANTVALDDTQGKIQLHLGSDEGNSQLNLGYITQIAGNAGRKEERGKGFELATRWWGVARAALGLLVTTDSLTHEPDPAKSAGDAIARLTQARQQHEDLAALASQHEAQAPGTNQSDVTAAIKTQNEAIRGAANDPFPEMTRPDLVLASAAGIAATAQDNVHLASGQDCAITAGRDISVSGGRSWFSVLRGVASWFAEKGMKLFAAGKVEIQAQKDAMDLTAQQDLTITSTDGKVVLHAAKEIWLGVGGSYIRITAQEIENATTGQILERCAKWDKASAASMSLPLPELPTGEMTSEWVTFIHHGTGQPLAKLPYRIDAGDGRITEGVSNAQGRSAEVLAPTSRAVQISADRQREPDTYHVPSRSLLDKPIRSIQQ